MYAFVTGPLAWLTFGIFFVGILVRIATYIRGLNWQMDRVTYQAFPAAGVRGAVRSVLYWLLPFGTHSWRFYPFFTILVFVFHICLLVTPVFLLGHNLLLQERWGFSLWTLPEAVTDGMTVALIVAAVFILLRRIALPEVRILTTVYDYFILLVSALPFFTGLMARYAVGDYSTWLLLHIFCGELLLILAPFTKLSHIVLFFMSRAQLGMDYGIKRGGMKPHSKGMAW